MAKKTPSLADLLDAFSKKSQAYGLAAEYGNAADVKRAQAAMRRAEHKLLDYILAAQSRAAEASPQKGCTVIPVAKLNESLGQALAPLVCDFSKYDDFIASQLKDYGVVESQDLLFKALPDLHKAALAYLFRYTKSAGASLFAAKYTGIISKS